MKTKWRIGLLIGGVLIALGLTLFLTDFLPLKQRSERTVGAVLPLTGDAAAYGKSMQRGMDIALAEIKELPSGSLKVLYEDSKADPKVALSAYRKLVDLNRVPAILGPFTSSETLALAPVAERDEVVLLATGASAPGITSAGDYTFRIVTSDIFDGDVVARFARKRLSFTRVALIHINNDYGVGVRDAFSRRFRDLGGDVVLAEGYSPTDSDQRTLLTKVRALSPDALFLVGYKEMGKVLRQASELGVKCAVLSTGLFEDPEILATAEGAAEGVYYSFASFDPKSPTPVVRTFTESFRAKYGSDPDILAALGYDAVRVMAQAYLDPASRGNEIRDRLYKTKGLPGAAGDLTFDQNGDVLKTFGIKRVQAGKFEWIVDRF